MRWLSAMAAIMGAMALPQCCHAQSTPPIPEPTLSLLRVRTNKLCYALREAGTITVSLHNTTTAPLKARLLLEVEGDLDVRRPLTNTELTVAPADSQVTLPLPALADYGHAVIATLSAAGGTVGQARDFFLVSDRPQQVGQLDRLSLRAEPDPGRSRAAYASLVELTDWAVEEAVQLEAAPDSAPLVQALVAGCHAQGLRVLARTRLREVDGLAGGEFLRRHPELGDWSGAAWSQPRALGLCPLLTGNPALVDLHTAQLLRAADRYGFDGFLYRDRYDYGDPAVDLLGRQMPCPGWDTPLVVKTIRRALNTHQPKLLFGHALEWDQERRSGPPMSLDVQPYAGDDYSEFVGWGGLHLQERFTWSCVADHERWDDVTANLARLGANAYRFGGCAYAELDLAKANTADGRLLTAVALASQVHLASAAPPAALGLMQAATRHADLLYGDNLTNVRSPEKLLEVTSPQPLWWQPYVRFREVEPGRRLYLVHLLNPSPNKRLGQGDAPPAAAVGPVNLRWSLPARWRAVRAVRIAADDAYVREPLALTGDAAQPQMVVPEVGTWTLVVLDCRGPVTDRAPSPIVDLPPLPERPTPQPAPALVTGERSPEHLRDPLVCDWRSFPGQPTVDDPTTTAGRALHCQGTIRWECAKAGSVIQGGAYRCSLRVRAGSQPPAGAKLTIACWPPPDQPGGKRYERSFELGELAPAKGWQTFLWDAELGYGGAIFTLLLSGGFDGLEIDQLTIAEHEVWPESRRMVERKLSGWPAGLRLAQHPGHRIWLGLGLYAHMFHLAEAARALPGVELVEAQHAVTIVQRGWFGSAWTSPAELASYDLVVIANADLCTFPLEQRAWLRGYLDAGGALLLAGGPCGFGRGWWGESDLLADKLPVSLHPYDLRPDGVDSPVPLLGDTTMLGTSTLWLHQARLRRGVSVWLRAGDWPAVVTGNADGQKVGCVLLAPLGDPPPGAKIWWESDAWPQLMTQVISELLKP